MARVVVVDESEGNASRVLAAVVREDFPYEHVVDADAALKILLDPRSKRENQVVVVGLLPPGDQRRLLMTMERERPELASSTIVISRSAEAASVVRGTSVQTVISLPFAVDELEDALIRCAARSTDDARQLQEVG